jgi:FixJ family two-component response regulator
MRAMGQQGTGRRITYVAVVDDDESVCRSFGRLLRTAGFQPVTYPSAEALLEDTKRPRFDCLVLDIQLGGMSGLELKRRLTAVKDPTPVVFITAYDEAAVRSEALACGCAGYFRKTDPGEHVLNAIRRAAGLVVITEFQSGSQGEGKKVRE